MRFAFYRFVSVVLQLIAWIALLAGVVVAIFAVSAPGDWMHHYVRDIYMWDLSDTGMRWGMFAAWLIGGIVTWACFLGFAGILHLLITIEGNSHAVRQAGAQAPVASAAFSCPVCHTSTQEGDKFCKFCGAKVGN